MGPSHTAQEVAECENSVHYQKRKITHRLMLWGLCLDHEAFDPPVGQVYSSHSSPDRQEIQLF